MLLSCSSVYSCHTGLVRKCYMIFIIFLINTQISDCYWNPLKNRKDYLLDDFSTPEECARSCRDDEPSKRCYYSFHVEFYATMGAVCDFISNQNISVARMETDQCILGDGVEKTVLSINRQIPGPSIQVCLHDTVIVDVENRAQGLSAAIHWHGLYQNGHQYYDGVPYVTQCPIEAGTTFRYQFAVDNPGTHMYHSHVGMFMIDGQYGSFIVRSPPSRNLYDGFYDEDLPEHVIQLNDWLHHLSFERFPGFFRQHAGQPTDNILINGQGTWTDPDTGITTDIPLLKFQVSPGKRYRFRLINTFSTTCLAEFVIQGHPLTLIEQDGKLVQAVQVHKIITSSGERVSFVLDANQKVDSYWIQVRGLGECELYKMQQMAILRYEGASEKPSSSAPKYDTELLPGVAYNSLDAEDCDGKIRPDRLCVNQLKTAGAYSPSLLRVTPDQRILLGVNYYKYHVEDLFKPGTYKAFFVRPGGFHLLSLINNISFAEPDGPLLTQDDGYEKMCNINEVSDCTQPCVCTHVYHIKKGALVEAVIFDEAPKPALHHAFHLHGNSFHVLSIGQRNEIITEQEKQNIINEHTKRLENREYRNPASKDTIKVPKGGYAIIRFFANNPGWWLFHCHFGLHATTGMSVVFHVGTPEDLPPVPEGFPQCRNWAPPPNFPKSTSEIPDISGIMKRFLG